MFYLACVKHVECLDYGMNEVVLNYFPLLLGNYSAIVSIASSHLLWYACVLQASAVMSVLA